MVISKEVGIVVDSKTFGEADRLITLLGESGEKSNFVLKGIRKSKNRPIVATELATLVEIIFYKHEHKEFYYSKEIHVIERFDQLKNDYIGFLLTNVFCEITHKLTPIGGEYKNIFELLQAALNSLNQNGFAYVSIPYFKLKLLRALGLVSSEFLCLSCEEDIFAKDSASINPLNLDIYCSDCKHSEKNQIETIKLMNGMMQKSYTILKKEKISALLISELDHILSSYIKNSLHLEFKSPEILYQAIGK